MGFSSVFEIQIQTNSLFFFFLSYDITSCWWYLARPPFATRWNYGLTLLSMAINYWRRSRLSFDYYLGCSYSRMPHYYTSYHWNLSNNAIEHVVHCSLRFPRHTIWLALFHLLISLRRENQCSCNEIEKMKYNEIEFIDEN